MKRLAATIRKKCKKSISKGSAVFLVVAGILLGTVFTVGMYYWTRPIEKTEAIRVDATFASYQKHYRRHNLNSLTLYFSDHELLSIDNVCFTSDVLNHIENMAPGTVLELYVHPNSDTILEMVCGGKVILDFNQAKRRLTTKRVSFLILGIFMYTSAAFGVVKLLNKGTY